MTLDGLSRWRPDDRDMLAEQQARETTAPGIQRLDMSDCDEWEVELLIDALSRLALTPLSAVKEGES